MTQKLFLINLPSSGVSIPAIGLSMATTIFQLKKKHPKPEPPTQEIEVLGVKQIEKNYSHPDYPLAVKAWEEMIQELAGEVALRKVAMVQQLTDEQKALVSDLRQTSGDILDIPADDRLAWLLNFAIGDDADFQYLAKEVSRQEIKEGSVREYIDLFRS